MLYRKIYIPCWLDHILINLRNVNTLNTAQA
ncbi:MAG: hypothetical protein [Bacteriophage sp.]|nr:MAG: hypothetical protein [Bacteriophage sp.]